MKEKQALIIGAGFGGLCIGVRLLAKGFKVTILEKASTPGGHASLYQEKGYTFDMGPSIITEPEIIDDVFKTAGRSLHDYIKLYPVEPFYRVYFHDSSFIDYTGNEDKMVEQIGQFNRGDAKRYKYFLRYSKVLYDTVITKGLGSKPFTSLIDLVKFAPFAITTLALLPAYFITSLFFKDFRTRFLFSFHALFIGGNPFTSPAIFLMLPFLEKAKGVWFAKGGMYSLVKALEKLYLEMGGIITYNAEVTSINIVNKRVESLSVGKTKYPCDLVVSNAHFAHTYKDLIDKTQRSKWSDSKITSMDYSMSCILLYLGVKKNYSKLLHHTLVISKDYKGLTDKLFKRKILPAKYSMYIHVPSKSDIDLAPVGSSSMYVLIPVPNLKSGINWSEQIKPFTKEILDFLENEFGLEKLNENIVVLKTFTPADFEKERNNYLGAPWSLQPTLTQIASFRPGNKSEEFENLYLVGASTHPGGGVPGVILSAAATESLILKDYDIN
jgi:phytoene desaturase